VECFMEDCWTAYEIPARLVGPRAGLPAARLPNLSSGVCAACKSLMFILTPQVLVDESILQFIAVHIRHGDFGGQCWEAARPEDCFAPLSAYAIRVKEVQDELRVKKGIVIPNNRVIVTSGAHIRYLGDLFFQIGS
jgi:hypothetical protein